MQLTPNVRHAIAFDNERLAGADKIGKVQGFDSAKSGLLSRIRPQRAPP